MKNKTIAPKGNCLLGLFVRLVIFAPFAELVEFKAFLELFLVLFTAISYAFAGSTFKFYGVILWHTGCYGQIISDKPNPVNWRKTG